MYMYMVHTWYTHTLTLTHTHTHTHTHSHSHSHTLTLTHTHTHSQWTVGEWPVTKPKKPPLPPNDILLSSTSSQKTPSQSRIKPHPQGTSSRGDFPYGADGTKQHREEQGMTTPPFGSPNMSRKRSNEQLDSSQSPQINVRSISNPHGALPTGAIKRTSSFEKHTASPSSNSSTNPVTNKQEHHHHPSLKNLELKLHDTVSVPQRNSSFSQHSQSPSRFDNNASATTPYSSSLRNSQLDSPIGNRTPEIRLTKVTTPTTTTHSSISRIPLFPPAYNSILEKSQVDSNYSPSHHRQQQQHQQQHHQQQHHQQHQQQHHQHQQQQQQQHQSHTRVDQIQSRSNPIPRSLTSSPFRSGSAFQPVVLPQTEQHMDTSAPQNYQHSTSSPPVGAHSLSNSRFSHQQSPQQRLSPAPSSVSGVVHPAINNSPPIMPPRQASPHTPQTQTQIHSPHNHVSHSPLHHQQVGTPSNPNQSQQATSNVHQSTGSPTPHVVQQQNVPHHLQMLQQRQQDAIQQYQQQQKQQLALAQRAMGQSQYSTQHLQQTVQPSFNEQQRQALLQQQMLHQQQQQRLMQLQQAQMQQAQQFMQQRSQPTQVLSHSPGSAYLRTGMQQYYQTVNPQLLQQQQQQHHSAVGGGTTNKTQLPHPQLTHINTLQRLGQESNRTSVGGPSNPPMMMSLNPYGNAYGEGIQLLPNGANFPAALQQTNASVSPLRHFNHGR